MLSLSLPLQSCRCCCCRIAVVSVISLPPFPQIPFRTVAESTAIVLSLLLLPYSCRFCHLVAAVATESSSHRCCRYRCCLVSAVAVVYPPSLSSRCRRCHRVQFAPLLSLPLPSRHCFFFCLAVISAILLPPLPQSPVRTVAVATATISLLMLLPPIRCLCHRVSTIATESSLHRRCCYSCRLVAGVAAV